MPSRWPDPADTALDRARQIARSVLAELADLAPERAAVLERAACQLGEHWLCPQADTVPAGELVSTERAAELLGVDQATVRGWGSKKDVPVRRYPGGWDLAELRAYRASQRRRRGHQ